MSKKVDIKTEPKNSAPDLLKEFLSQNNISLKLEVQQAGFVDSGDGFLMTDKPLIKLTPRFRE